MLLDAHNTFADAQVVAATAISNVIDLKQGDDNATRNVGAGVGLWLVVKTNTTATDSGSDATLTITYETSANADLTSSTVVFSTATLAFADFATAGTGLIAVRVPSFDYQEFVGVRFTVASGPLTAGAFDAFLAQGIDDTFDYAIRSVITG